MADADLFEERLRALREAMDLRFGAHDRAAAVQTMELARRLDMLNGEAARLAAMQATYLPREVYEKEQSYLRKVILGVLMLILGAFAAAVFASLISRGHP